jgi:uncharacterized protein (TIGR02611 family)
MAALMFKGMQQAKRLIIAIMGFTVLLTGIAMIMLPGPAIVVIPLGLGILATEFIWARRLLSKAKNTLNTFKKGGDINEAK